MKVQKSKWVDRCYCFEWNIAYSGSSVCFILFSYFPYGTPQAMLDLARYYMEKNKAKDVIKWLTPIFVNYPECAKFKRIKRLYIYPP